MTEFVIEVKDSETKFIKNLLKKFDFVNIKKQRPTKASAEKQRILENIEEAVKEFNLYKEGKIELQSWESFQEELKNEGYI